MLSLRKLVRNSAVTSSVILNASMRISCSVPSRSYLPGRDWPTVGGIYMKDGVPQSNKANNGVYSSRKGKCGIIVLDNSKSNHLMTSKQYDDLLKELLKYESNEHLGSALIMNSSVNHFANSYCYPKMNKGLGEESYKNYILKLKRKQYSVINQIHISDIPILSIMDGLVYNEGSSIGFSSKYPIITDRTVLKFNQLHHHLFYDAATTKFLSSLGGLGMYLALTNSQLEGLELMYFGVGRYYIEHCNVDDLVDDLGLNHSRNSERIEDIIESASVPYPSPSEDIISKYNEIAQLFNPCFVTDYSVLDLIKRLETTSDFSRSLLKKMEGSVSSLQVVFKSIVEASKLSIHGTLKRDYMMWTNFLKNPQCSELSAPFLQTMRGEKVKSEPIDLTAPIKDCAEAMFSSNPEGNVGFDKIVHYDIPLFRGDYNDNDKHFETFINDKYDWNKVNHDLYHLHMEGEGEGEETKDEAVSLRERGFVHPATGLVHPVPLEWEEDLKMAKDKKIRQRKRQMSVDSEIVLSNVVDSDAKA